MTSRSFAVLFALSIGGTAGASEVDFPSARLEASAPETMISGQLHKPAGSGPYPAVVLLHSCNGLSPHITSDWPRFLVGLGYVVLVVDTLSSRGYHKNCGPLKNRNQVQARDAYGALEYLAQQKFVDAGRIAAAGFSMGAGTINNAILRRAPLPAGQPEFKAFAAFYGNCGAMKSGTVREAPLLQIVAELDVKLAPSCIEASRTIKMEIHVLPGAHHAFDQPQATQPRPDINGNTMLYDAASSEKSRLLLQRFLEHHLLSNPSPSDHSGRPAQPADPAR